MIYKEQIKELLGKFKCTNFEDIEDESIMFDVKIECVDTFGEVDKYGIIKIDGAHHSGGGFRVDAGLILQVCEEFQEKLQVEVNKLVKVPKGIVRKAIQIYEDEQILKDFDKQFDNKSQINKIEFFEFDSKFYDDASDVSNSHYNWNWIIEEFIKN